MGAVRTSAAATQAAIRGFAGRRDGRVHEMVDGHRGQEPPNEQVQPEGSEEALLVEGRGESGLRVGGDLVVIKLANAREACQSLQNLLLQTLLMPTVSFTFMAASSCARNLNTAGM